MALFSGSCRILYLRVLSPRASHGSKAPPSGKEWLHEIKHDGFRVIARKVGERVKLGGRASEATRPAWRKQWILPHGYPLPSEEPKGDDGDAPQGAGLVPRDIGDVLNGLNLCPGSSAPRMRTVCT
jgi:hypothetical protein